MPSASFHQRPEGWHEFINSLRRGSIARHDSETKSGGLSQTTSNKPTAVSCREGKAHSVQR